MQSDILREQMAYYEARAREYDESIFQTGRYARSEQVDQQEPLGELSKQVATLLATFAPCEHILELACGTGIWTSLLVSIGQQITALDASAEMLKINAHKLADPRVTYHQVNLFEWEPEQTYDLVFFGFWLSHVPPDHLETFFAKVSRAVKPGGRIVILDQYTPTGEDLEAARQNIYHERSLHDGRTFTIIKVFYDPANLRTILARSGFLSEHHILDQTVFFLSAQHQESF